MNTLILVKVVSHQCYRGIPPIHMKLTQIKGYRPETANQINHVHYSIEITANNSRLRDGQALITLAAKAIQLSDVR